jgi:hypothetical protein
VRLALTTALGKASSAEEKLHAALSLTSITGQNDVVGQKTIDEAIHSGLKDADAETISRVAVDRPEIASRYFPQLIDALKKPDSYAEEASLISILKRIEPVINGADAASKNELSRKLMGWLDETNTDYARYFPSLREQSIKNLAMLDAKESIPLIRQHLLAGHEGSAAARLAGLQALQQLGDPTISTQAFQMNKLDADPAVRAQAEDVYFSVTGKALTSAPRLDAGQHVSLLTDNFPLLERQGFMQQLEITKRNQSSFFDNFSAASQKQHDAEAVRKVETARLQQFLELKDLSGRPGKAGADAQRAIYQIARRYNSLTESDLDLQRRATAALADNCLAGAPNRSAASALVAEALTDGNIYDKQARESLLVAWRRAGRNDSGDLSRGIMPERSSMTKMQHYSVLEAAFLAELKRPLKEQSNDYQRVLIANMAADSPVLLKQLLESKRKSNSN